MKPNKKYKITLKNILILLFNKNFQIYQSLILQRRLFLMRRKKILT